MCRDDTLSIQPLGDAALIVAPRGDASAGWAAAARAALLATPLAGVTDLTPAFGVLGVFYDPSAISSGPDESAMSVVRAWLRSSLGELSIGETNTARQIDIPVCYDADFGLDQDALAAHARLTRAEVIARHAAGDYVVGAIGFQPGFAYLTGLSPELHTPRRSSPRTRVAAGSVGIGGAYTGIYPAESPGGWNLIGRTPTGQYNASSSPDSLLKVSDRVRFIPISAEKYELLSRQAERTAPHAPNSARPALVRIVSPCPGLTLQGTPQQGQQHNGVSPGGPMDASSQRLANRLVGNPHDAKTVEATLIGPRMEALRDLSLGIAGATPLGFGGARRIELSAGGTIDLRTLAGGSRLYVATPGGFSALSGDTLFGINEQPPGCLQSNKSQRWSLNFSAFGIRDADGTVALRVLRGPQAEHFAAGAWRCLVTDVYRIGSHSDRAGIRCEGTPLLSDNVGAMPSQPVCHGALQVPPDGQPIILGADRFTLGGYPMIAAVVSADWPALGQLRPGDRVRFVETTLAAAERARHAAEAELNRLEAAIDLRRSHDTL
ncbi:5-oxoprolinase subunit PxpB [Botrimarina hoheduenensis]|uniref:Kinase A inhibitor n=1 Tax=Botrimarina hoheduenensis TaxID=2528000 RepID=A0A5C5VZ23_9BACT|nr:5-oxoprolinase subunit PxpB [Botrimarina hoheduenensis]TWT43213.1 Kinase A inhibitor [Botrimarina hoheduenensis]